MDFLALVGTAMEPESLMAGIGGEMGFQTKGKWEEGFQQLFLQGLKSNPKFDEQCWGDSGQHCQGWLSGTLDLLEKEILSSEWCMPGAPGQGLLGRSDEEGWGWAAQIGLNLMSFVLSKKKKKKQT